MAQMCQRGRGRGRFPSRGRGRTAQESLSYAQYQQFMEFHKKNSLKISEESEARSRDHDPPRKVLKIEEEAEGPWIKITGKLLEQNP